MGALRSNKRGAGRGWTASAGAVKLWRRGAGNGRHEKTSSGLALGIIGALFFIFGFVTWLNGPLITFVKLAFTLDDRVAFLVPFAFYISYFVLSLPAALDP